MTPEERASATGRHPERWTGIYRALAVREVLAVVPIIGIYLMALSTAMLPPAFMGWHHGESSWVEFIVAFCLTFLTGFFLSRIRPWRAFGINLQSLFLLTTLVWCAVSVFSAIPFVLVEHISFTDAVFETVSGITTTGATVLSGLDNMEYSILLWRSLLQWFGGIGFVITGIALLPFLSVGGMRLFRTESSDWSHSNAPRIRGLARGLVLLYLGITGAAVAAYMLTGMNLFEAVNHAMTTVSTGGFSTSDNSLQHFPPGTHWVACVFMVLGSLPFMLMVQSIRERSLDLFRDEQVIGLLKFLLLVILAMALWLYSHSDHSMLDALRLCAVNIISVVSTTGFVVTDFSQWGLVPVIGFFLLLSVGGCSGSTSGGVKIFRFQLAGLFLRQELRRLLHPSVVLSWKYNGKTVTPDVLQSLVAFSWAYMVTVAIITLLLALGGLDVTSSLTGSLTAVANVGPGLGDVIGPANNFESLHDYHKWVLAAGMLLGRLEILTVLVLFTADFWRS